MKSVVVSCGDTGTFTVPVNWELKEGDDIEVRNADDETFPMCMVGCVYALSEGYRLVSFGGLLGKLEGAAPLGEYESEIFLMARHIS